MDAPELTNHTSSGLEVLVELEAVIEFALCLITKKSSTIVVVEVGCVICELSTCESQLVLLFATLSLVVAKIATISTLSKVVLTTRLGMATPPSS